MIKYITLTKFLLVLSYIQLLIKSIQGTFLLSWIKKFNVKVFICLMVINSYNIRDLLFVGSLQWSARPIVMHMSWYSKKDTGVFLWDHADAGGSKLHREWWLDYRVSIFIPKPMLFFTWEGFEAKSYIIDFNKRYT